MPIRSASKTYDQRIPPKSPENQSVQFEAENFLAGLVTDHDPSNIPLQALQNIKNAIYIRGQLFRRNGLSSYGLAKPNSNPVLAMYLFYQATTGINLFRFTRNSVHKVTNSGWQNFTGPGLVGANSDPYSFATADNRGFFSNNGANVIMELLPGSNTYAALGDAPQAKYITSAFNRIIAANYVSPNKPYNIGWSGDLNYGEWNPATDISAGNTPLVNSPADLSDDITGVFNLDSALCIPRQRSLWLATNQPSATNPFYFYPDVPRIGADLPQTIAIRDQGLLFYNLAEGKAYAYAPGSTPQEFSQPIKRNLKASIDSTSVIIGSYNLDLDCYSIFITSKLTSTVKCFHFFFETKTWTYAEFMNVTSVSDISYTNTTFTINQLTGTISSLQGPINQLGGLTSNSSRFYGFSTGDLSTQPVFYGMSSKVGDIVPNDNGVSYTTIFDSKLLTVPNYDSIWNNLNIGVTPYTTGTITIQYSKDGGNTFITYKSLVIDNTKLYTLQEILCKKPKRAKTFIWRVTSSDCMFALNKFRIEADPITLSQH